MKRLTVTLLLLAALVGVPAAVAGTPFQFSNRAKIEKAVAAMFVTWPGHRRDRVRSIGCAKSGTGRLGCVVVTTSASRGVALWEVALSCPSDAGVHCRYQVSPWTATP